VGGHCISVDPWFLVEAAPDLSQLIWTARKVNDLQPHFVFNLVQEAVGSLRGKKIAVLGLAYKPDVDDLRESPAAEVARLLTDAGADIHAFEPFKVDGLPSILMAPSLENAIQDAEAILLLVRHTQFCQITPEDLAGKTSARTVIDTVNAWDAESWGNAGFDIFRLGVGK